MHVPRSSLYRHKLLSTSEGQTEAEVRTSRGQQRRRGGVAERRGKIESEGELKARKAEHPSTEHEMTRGSRAKRLWKKKDVQIGKYQSSDSTPVTSRIFFFVLFATSRNYICSQATSAPGRYLNPIL